MLTPDLFRLAIRELLVQIGAAARQTIEKQRAYDAVPVGTQLVLALLAGHDEGQIGLCACYASIRACGVGRVKDSGVS